MAAPYLASWKPSMGGEDCPTLRPEGPSFLMEGRLRDWHGRRQSVSCFQVIELGQHVHEGTSEQHVYALVGSGEEPAVHLLPESPQTKALLSASPSPLHFWRCNATTGMPSDWCISDSAILSRWTGKGCHAALRNPNSWSPV